ncbi:MAG: hypothetical protein CSA50_04000 [Gammaproteobacteria bacterium]|nr:MAG: hypothetical protein CSA50_04000 [Gammaproteobacteria bacterium]
MGNNVTNDVTVHPEPHSLKPRCWYCSSPDGDSAIRIQNGLKVGELADGTLTLDNKADDNHQWIEFRLNQSGELSVSVLGGQCRLKVENKLKKTVKLIPGTLIQLPYNRFYISDSVFGLEQTDLTIKLIEHATDTELPNSPTLPYVTNNVNSIKPKNDRSRQTAGLDHKKAIAKKKFSKDKQTATETLTTRTQKKVNAIQVTEEDATIVYTSQRLSVSNPDSGPKVAQWTDRNVKPASASFSTVFFRKVIPGVIVIASLFGIVSYFTSQ